MGRTQVTVQVTNDVETVVGVAAFMCPNCNEAFKRGERIAWVWRGYQVFSLEHEDAHCNWGEDEDMPF